MRLTAPPEGGLEDGTRAVKRLARDQTPRRKNLRGRRPQGPREGVKRPTRPTMGPLIGRTVVDPAWRISDSAGSKKRNQSPRQVPRGAAVAAALPTQLHHPAQARLLDLEMNPKSTSPQVEAQKAEKSRVGVQPRLIPPL